MYLSVDRLRRRRQLGMKVGFAFGEQHDFKLTLLTFGDCGAVDLHWMSVGRGVLDLDGTAAAQLDAIVEVGSGGQFVGAKAGAGIVDLKLLDRGSGAVLYGGFHMVGVATGCGSQSYEQEGRKGTSAGCCSGGLDLRLCL